LTSLFSSDVSSGPERQAHDQDRGSRGRREQCGEVRQIAAQIVCHMWVKAGILLPINRIIPEFTEADLNQQKICFFRD